MTRDEWEALLDGDPADPQRRLEYADWLAEQGLEVEAEVQRWLARQGRYPARSRPWWLQEPVTVSVWMNEFFLPHGPYTLPHDLFVRLPHESPGIVPYPYGKSVFPTSAYRSRAAAEAALVEAWRRAKADGWRP